MSWYTDTFGIGPEQIADAKSDKRQMAVIGPVRISVLTTRMIRVEVQSSALFCDLPTQGVINRNLDCPEFEVSGTDVIKITTADASFEVSASDGSVRGNFSGNLGGTARTLDNTNGSVKLSDGVCSRSGLAMIDDSGSMMIRADGHFEKRPQGTDRYYFAYGHDYSTAVQDYCRLTGPAPLIPRFALGSWWSRYKAYTQQEYLDLMAEFRRREIPITVATADMDWHWVDITRRFGPAAAKTGARPHELKSRLTQRILPAGWTGYTWNTELFPDYRAFLKQLNDWGLKVTLNLHPADGVRFFEKQYKDFAELMGIDPKSRKPISMDFMDEKYTEGHFKLLHHEYEQEGVRFWWIDWQQGKDFGPHHVDNLGILNHLYSKDMEARGIRPLILSRFGGIGSQRYPLGFSGDTFVSWRSLELQPEFTAQASNIGYTWWSHDIGGHMNGVRNDELYLRWVQYGVFSPILRLHSSNNPFFGKEPWTFGAEANRAATDAIRFRHRLIPYLYSMNYRTAHDNIPLVQPMYWQYPETEDAYSVPNEYFFGSELIAAPITRPKASNTNLAFTDVWLPEGRWTDIFSGRMYHAPKGGVRFEMFRGTDSIPVLAKGSAILPLAVNDRTNDCSNPAEMELRLYRGSTAGHFDLYEDDGETMAYRSGASAMTAIDFEGSTVVIRPAQGDLSVLPPERKWHIHFTDAAAAENICASADGADMDFKVSTSDIGGTVVTLAGVSPAAEIRVELNGVTLRKNLDKTAARTEIISRVQGSNDIKQMLYSPVIKHPSLIKGLPGKALREALEEADHYEY